MLSLAEQDNPYAHFLKEGVIYQGLTPSQEAYAQARVDGLKAVDAYELAYGKQSSRQVANRSAYDVDRHPKVLARVVQLQVERAKASRLVDIVDRSFVINGIAAIALNGEKESNRLSAYFKLGTMVGIDLFRDVKVIEKRERTPEDVERELKEKLDTLRHTIEGAANPAKSEGASAAPLSTRAPDALPSAKLKPRDRHAKSKP